MSEATLTRQRQGRSKLAQVKINKEFNTKAFHMEMQQLREQGEDVTLKSYLAENFGPEYTPEKMYYDLDIDLSKMTVQKMLNTSELNKYLFPEIFRDAVRQGLEYSPFFPQLIVADEGLEGDSLTMPSMDFRDLDPAAVRLFEVNEGATIPEGKIITWQDKRVSVKKKARGLKQTYESIMWTPINLAAIYFEEVGTRLGADLDADLVAVALNGDQADGSQASPVIGASVAGTLTYNDIARAWMRFKRLGRTSVVMLCSEADALTILGLPEFQRTQAAGNVTPSGVTLQIENPLPTTQRVLVHAAVPTGKIIFVDTARAFVKLTAMPLLVETERIVSRQITGEYVSLITGFANVFKDGRIVLDYTTNLTTNPGPAVYV